MSLYRKEIFPLSYYHGCVLDNEKLKELIIPYIEKAHSEGESDKPPSGWLTHNLITSFDSKNVQEAFLDSKSEMGIEIRNQYFSTISSFIGGDWILGIDQMWYNVYVNGEYQEAHTHLAENNIIHYACVHFLSYNPEIHSPLTFSDPLSKIRFHSVEFPSHNYNEKHRPPIKEGDFLMFPSYLDHEVKAGPPTPEYPRITISFNIRLNKDEPTNNKPDSNV